MRQVRSSPAFFPKPVASVYSDALFLSKDLVPYYQTIANLIRCRKLCALGVRSRALRRSYLILNVVDFQVKGSQKLGARYADYLRTWYYDQQGLFRH
jgi:hypothetical protein